MRRGFTLFEVVATVVIILILASCAIVGYRQLLDNTRQKVCENNLRTLRAAVEIYAIENDVLPASLGQLELEHFQKGYAKVMEKSGWYMKFSYFFVKVHTPSEVHAGVSCPFLDYETLRKYGVTINVFTCPASSYSPGVSTYGMNVNLAGRRWDAVLPDEIIIFEGYVSVGDPSTDIEYRHIKDFGLKKMGHTITKSGKIIENIM